MKAVDYRGLRINNLTSPAYRHIFYLIFWPIYGLSFFSLETIENVNFTNLYVPFDDIIPFCEYFLIPYFFWYIFIVWMVVYSFFFDVEIFKKYHQFLIIVCGVTCLIYLLWPNMQSLRPTEFTRDNIFIHYIKKMYDFDTNTNVCPSLHVVMSFAVFFASWYSKRYRTVPWRIAFSIMTVIISISTVFLKQHSIIDVYAGVALSLIAYFIVFFKDRKKLLGDR